MYFFGQIASRSNFASSQYNASIFRNLINKKSSSENYGKIEAKFYQTEVELISFNNSFCEST